MRRPSAAQQKWVWRGLALAVITTHATFVLIAYPMEDRWFLAPDDHDTFVFARQVAATGVPSLPYGDRPYANLSEYPLFLGEHVVLDDRGSYATHSPFGVMFLLAVPAAFSVEATFIAMQILAAGTLAAFYLLANRIAGPPAALVGLVFFAATPAMLFWPGFLKSNVPAVGVLLTGLLFLTSRQRGWSSLGAFLLVASTAFRFEFGLVALTVFTAWLVVRHRQGVPPKDLLFPVVAAGLATGLFVAVCLATYGTVNILQIVVEQPVSSADEAFSTTVGSGRSENLRANFAKFQGLLVAPLVVTLSLFWSRPRERAMLFTFGAAVVFLSLFFLSNRFASHPYLLTHSITRYLIPFLALAGLATAVLAQRAQGRRMLSGILVGAVLLLALGGAAIAAGPDGLESASTSAAYGRQHQAVADWSEPDSVFVGEHSGKWIIDREVLLPTKVPEDVRRQEVRRVVDVLLDLGVPVYFPKFAGSTYIEWFRTAGGYRFESVAADADFLEIHRI